MKTIILYLLMMMATPVLAQQAIDSLAVDSIALPSLSASYYEQRDFLSHNYDYEVVNKQRRMETLAKNVAFFGAGIYAIAIGAGAFIFENIGCPIWIYLPTCLVVGVGGQYALSKWSEQLSKRARQLGASTAYLLPLGRNAELGAVHFSRGTLSDDHAFGLSIKTTF